jgi:5-methylcytosine-specific restriction enzyme subunit McrC
LPELEPGGVTSAALDRIHLTRATQRYEKALLYARMILEQRGPQLRAGRTRVFALLFDMNALWERYIAVLLRRAAPPGLRVSAQERHLFWTPDGLGARRVRPDIVVRHPDGTPLLVIDTKWKVPSSGLPSDDDLKQMFVYNELLIGARSVLLYPRTTKSFNARGAFATKEHDCEQRHVGLFEGSKWSTALVKDQLAEILGDLSPSRGHPRRQAPGLSGGRGGLDLDAPGGGGRVSASGGPD